MRLEGGGGGHDIYGVFDCFLAWDPGEGTSAAGLRDHRRVYN
jgi:hypothetical protein